MNMMIFTSSIQVQYGNLLAPAGLHFPTFGQSSGPTPPAGGTVIQMLTLQRIGDVT